MPTSKDVHVSASATLFNHLFMFLMFELCHYIMSPEKIFLFYHTSSSINAYAKVEHSDIKLRHH